MDWSKFKDKVKNIGTSIVAATTPCMVKTYKELTIERMIVSTKEAIEHAKLKHDLKQYEKLQKRLGKLRQQFEDLKTKTTTESQEETSDESQ